MNCLRPAMRLRAVWMAVAVVSAGLVLDDRLDMLRDRPREDSEASTTPEPAAMTLVGHEVLGVETETYPPAHSRAWGEDIGLHAVSVIAGTLAVQSIGATPTSYGPGQGYVAGWAPYLTVTTARYPWESWSPGSPGARPDHRTTEPGPTSGPVLDRFSTGAGEDRSNRFYKEESMRNRVRILLGMVLVTALLAPSAPGAANDGEHGGKLVFSRRVSGLAGAGNTELFLMNADGSGVTQLTYSPYTDSEPAWSPDGGRVAFQSNRDGNVEIYVIGADGTGESRLTFNPARDSYPSWTADGRILFESDRDRNGEIYVMNADGTGQNNLTSDPARDISPDAPSHGNFVAFASIRDGNMDIYTAVGPGLAMRRLTDHAANDNQPNWSPRLAQLLFTSNRDGNNEVYVMRRNGSDQRRLTHTPNRAEFGPSWSPDGHRVAFTGCVNVGTPQQRCDVYVMNADGSGEVQLTTSENGSQPDWRPVR